MVAKLSEVGGRYFGCSDSKPSTTVDWCPKPFCRDGRFAKPLKDGADWLAGGGAEGRKDENGDVSIGGRIGRVGVDDVELTGRKGDELNGCAEGVSGADVIDDEAPNGCPGEKAGAFGSRVG